MAGTDNIRFEFSHYNSMDFGSYGLGASVSPNGPQSQTTNMAINWGMQNLEISLPPGMNFQQQGHLAQMGALEREEVIRLAKMNSVNLSIHAPILDPAGFNRGEFSEEQRFNAVNDFKKTIDFADQVGTKNHIEHVPIVFHSSEQVPGNPMPNDIMYVVNRESKQLAAVKKKEVRYDQEYFDFFHLKRGTDYATDPNTGKTFLFPIGEMKVMGQEQLKDLEEKENYTKYWKDQYERQLAGADAQIKALIDQGSIKEAEKYIMQSGRPELIDDYKRFKVYADREFTTNQQIKDMRRKYSSADGERLDIYVPAENFAKEKFVETIAEIATYAYNKESKPMICVENFYPELALSDPKKLMVAVDDARTAFVNKLVKEQGVAPDAAKQAAVQMIGMTFDVGHANLFKKYKNPETGKNYTDDDIKSWVAEIYPSLKHVHITDNFGDYDAHLPVGWGTAPITDMMKMLKEKGFSGRAILETFGQVNFGGQQIGVPASLYGMNFPLGAGAPTWETAAGSYFQAGYAFSVGPVYPDVSVREYGTGFSGLPYATGGQLGGGQPGSQFSGAPMS